MKKLLTILAVAIMAVGLVPLSHADSLSVTVNVYDSSHALLGSQSWSCTAANGTTCFAGSPGMSLSFGGDHTIGTTGVTLNNITANDNAPGSSLNGNASETDATVSNLSGDLRYVQIVTTATTFTQPTGPLFLFASGGISIGSVTPGTTAFALTGSATDLTSNATTTSGPCTISLSLPNCTTPSSFFTYGPDGYSLTSTADLTLASTTDGNGGITGDSVGVTTKVTAAVPEPASMLLFGSGLFGLAGVIRRKFRA